MAAIEFPSSALLDSSSAVRSGLVGASLVFSFPRFSIPSILDIHPNPSSSQRHTTTTTTASSPSLPA